MLAGMCAAAAVQAILPGPLNVSTTLGSGVSPARGVFLEMFLTSLLVFTIFMLAAEKHKATFLAPVGIGLSLFVAEMVGVFFTGGRYVHALHTLRTTSLTLTKSEPGPQFRTMRGDKELS